MKITSVEYSKTFNLGNYQSAKIGYVAECGGDNPQDVLQHLRNIVDEEAEREGVSTKALARP